jgi:hypothetical protein
VEAEEASANDLFVLVQTVADSVGYINMRFDDAPGCCRGSSVLALTLHHRYLLFDEARPSSGGQRDQHHHVQHPHQRAAMHTDDDDVYHGVSRYSRHHHQLPSISCPSGHPCEDFVFPPSHYCNVCGRTMGGEQGLRCARCDWDVCSDCAAGAGESSSDMQSDLHPFTAELLRNLQRTRPSSPEMPMHFDHDEMPMHFDHNQMPMHFDHDEMPMHFDHNQMPMHFDHNEMPMHFDHNQMPMHFDHNDMPMHHEHNGLRELIHNLQVRARPFCRFLFYFAAIVRVLLCGAIVRVAIVWGADARRRCWERDTTTACSSRSWRWNSSCSCLVSLRTEIFTRCSSACSGALSHHHYPQRQHQFRRTFDIFGSDAYTTLGYVQAATRVNWNFTL